MTKKLQSRELLNLPIVRQSLNDAKCAFIDIIEYRLCQEMGSDEQQSGDCAIESPIEVIYLAWWMTIDAARQISNVPLQIDLLPQYTVSLANNKTYRVDFVVRPTDVPEWYDANEKGICFPDIAVELDGHEWHERTKEQVASRNRRDRALQSAGWKVFHFSGSEVVRRPLECVTEVMDFANGALWQMRKQLRTSRRNQKGA